MGDNRLRHYATNTEYRIFAAPPSDAREREARLHLLYGEVCAQWRNLHDTRFKLLALVPISTILTVLLAFRDSTEISRLLPSCVAFGLGFVMVVGLRIYDSRNSELYDDLISRGRRIEAELGIETGVFRGRLRPRNDLVSHGVATGLIYTGSIAVWGGAFLLTLYRLAVALI